MSDWDLLGLAPTQELAAIKKAYALKLRVTRPDEDAGAYQALRGAYERAQRWAKGDLGRASEPPPAAEAAVPDPVKSDGLLPVTCNGDSPAPLAVEDRVAEITRKDLLEWIQRLSECARPQSAGLSAWTEIHPLLLSVPLYLQPEASVRFADFVLAQPGLPAQLVEEMQLHFEWLDDYRVARILGPARLNALRETLGDRLARPIRDPDVLKRVAPLIHLHRLLLEKKSLAALWFAVSLGKPLQQLARQVDERMRQRLGLPEVSWSRQLRVASGVRVLGVLLALYGVGIIGLLARGQELDWVVLLGVAVVVPALLQIFMMVAARMNWAGLGLGRRLDQRWLAWRNQVRYTDGGLITLLLVALYRSSGPEGPLVVYSWGGLLLGLLLAWPRKSGHATVAFAAIPLCTLMLALMQFPPNAGAAALAWAALWVLAGCRIYAQEGAKAQLAVLFRPVINSLSLCDGYGVQFALTPVLMALTIMVSVGEMRGTWLFVAWTFCILGLGRLQRWLTKTAMASIC